MMACEPEATPQAKSVELVKEDKLNPEQIAAQPFDYRGLVVYELYTDASFTNANENRKSVTGYVSIMADACITWKSSRQDTVSLHTGQAELVAASDGKKESEWLWMLLEELGFKQDRPILCWCDNKGAISIIRDPTNHASTKRIDTKGLYAREVHDKRIIVQYCSTNDL
ncbi:unnamed protein product [Phytophthora lilii]|uniref:Unnamed protein product n=1 Tax=Phytophthora lilii TaxID=2077276 RepID=A0A9W6TFG8_9STRA|nr:unnamed protein product [Phytophthora lilii]